MELKPIRAAQAPSLTLTLNPHKSKVAPNLGGSEEQAQLGPSPRVAGLCYHFWFAVRLGVVPLSRAVTTIQLGGGTRSSWTGPGTSSGDTSVPFSDGKKLTVCQPGMASLRPQLHRSLLCPSQGFWSSRPLVPTVCRALTEYQPPCHQYPAQGGPGTRQALEADLPTASPTSQKGKRGWRWRAGWAPLAPQSRFPHRRHMVVVVQSLSRV